VEALRVYPIPAATDRDKIDNLPKNRGKIPDSRLTKNAKKATKTAKKRIRGGQKLR
jgi:hypothetical protein